MKFYILGSNAHGLRVWMEIDEYLPQKASITLYEDDCITIAGIGFY